MLTKHAVQAVRYLTSNVLCQILGACHLVHPCCFEGSTLRPKYVKRT